jgi:hypothetical protein
MLNHLVQIRVGLVGSSRDNFHNVKMTGEPASADTVAVSLYGMRLSFL